MDNEIKTKWLASLRGGRYQQATGCLRDDKGFCCLGVLLDVSDKGEWSDDDDGTYRIEGRGYDGDLGASREIFSISKEQEKTLVAMNDGDKEFKNNPQSFAQIADYIEANL